MPPRHRRDADSNGTAATPSTRLDRRAGCADKACEDAPDKEECDRKKSMMQLMQSMDQGACKRHTDGQVAACKCVKPDEAPARRLKTIKEVYEKNGGDAAKAEGLAAKADTSKKFGALLHKLVAKYPAMIKKVADPQQEDWEKIMKEGIVIDIPSIPTPCRIPTPSMYTTSPRKTASQKANLSGARRRRSSRRRGGCFASWSGSSAGSTAM